MKQEQPIYVEDCFARISSLGHIEAIGWRKVILPGLFCGTLLITGTVYHEDMSLAKDLEIAQAICGNIKKILLFNGDFCGVLIQATKATVFSDRMCARKVYCTISEKTFCVGTRMDTVAVKTKQLDLSQTAIGMLLFEKALVTQNSWYDAIKPLGIGMCANFSFLTKKLTFKRYDPVFMKGRSNDCSSQELGIILSKALEDSVLGIIKTFGIEHLMMAFSGGLDSRLIAAVLHKHGIIIPTFVLETDHGFDEIEIAHRINEYYGFPMHSIPQPNGYFMQHVDKCITSMEYTMCEHVWFTEATPWLKQQKRVCYTGLIVGEMMRVNNATSNQKTISQEKKFREDFKKTFEKTELQYRFLQPEFLSSVAYKYKNNIQKELKRNFQSAGNLQDYYLESRANRQVLRLLELLRPYVYCVQPFSTNRILDTLFSVPVDKLGGNLYSEIFQHIDPGSEKLISTRNVEDRAKVDAIPIQREQEETIDFLTAHLQEGILGQEGLVNIQKLNDYANHLKTLKRPNANILMRLYTLELRKREIERLKNIKAEINCKSTV